MTTPTPPSDLIERMAKAICYADGTDGCKCIGSCQADPPGWKFPEFAQAAYAVVRERIETLEGLLWRAIDDASIDPDTWYAEARSALKQRIDP